MHIYSTTNLLCEAQHSVNNGKDSDSLTREVEDIRGAVYSDCIAATEAVVESAVRALNDTLYDFNEHSEDITMLLGYNAPKVLEAVCEALEELNTVTDRQYELKAKFEVVRKHDEEVEA